MPQINQQDVQKFLGDFGVTATPDIMASFSGLDDIDALQLLGDYATSVKAETARQASDPLNSYIKMAGDYTTQMMGQAQTMYGQMQDLLSSAPKLFGNLTPDQVNEYLSPLQDAFTQAQAQTSGDFARRGLTGSSTEASALSQGTTTFEENVLSQGLSVGQQAQTAQASAMAARIQQLMTGAGQTFGLEGQATGQKSAQDLSQSNLLASLPYFLQQSDQATMANYKAQNNKGTGFLNSLGQVNQAINLGGNILSLGMLDRVLPSKGGTPAPSGGSSSPYPSSSAPAVPNYSGAFQAVSTSPTGAAVDPAAVALL